jgi:cyclohexanone monooxygenase
MFWTFNDLTTDEESNEAACEFIRKKIRQTVKDPKKAEKLCPTDFYARRPLCDAGYAADLCLVLYDPYAYFHSYYEQFNRPNVDIVDLKETKITEFTEKGIRTSDGTDHELDVIIFATGFDAVDGNVRSPFVYTCLPALVRR